MKISTLFWYLLGSRNAIHTIATDRRAIWIGLLFVISAGLAREYDGEDLLHEPWYAFIPVVASLAASLILFVVLAGPMYLAGRAKTPFLSAYRSFLSLFWMTAPLAWVYAIPYERFFEPAVAIQANLWSLGIVAAWRVILTMRVAAVILRMAPFAAVMLVMLVADALALIAVTAMPKPIIEFMGGVHLTEAEHMIVGVTFMTYFFGILSAPIWLLGSVVSLVVARPNWAPVPNDNAPRAGLGVWLVALGSVAGGIALLPIGQAEQVRRYRVEHAFRLGQIAEAIDYMSARSQKDFPPSWDPPPHVAQANQRVTPIDVLEVIVKRQPAPWVRQIYVKKLDDFMGERYQFEYRLHRHGPELGRIVRILEAMPEGRPIANRLAEDIVGILKERSGTSDEERKHLEAILRVAGREPPKRPVESKAPSTGVKP